MAIDPKTLSVAKSYTDTRLSDELTQRIVGTEVTPTLLADNITLIATKTTSRTYAPMFFNAQYTNITFTIMRTDLWYIIGGNADLYTGIAFASEDSKLKILDFLSGSYSQTGTRPSTTVAAVGDIVNIVTSPTAFVFTIKRVGESAFASWFTLTKADYPSVTGWANNSVLGFNVNASNDTNHLGLMKNVYLGAVPLVILPDVAGVTAQIVEVNTYLERQKYTKWDAMGDSITASDLYPPLVATRLGIPTTNNNGISGTYITATGVGDTNAMSIRYASLDNTADLVTVFGGTNDYGFSRPLGAYGDATYATFYGALKVLIEGILTNMPTARLVFFTPTQRNYLGGGQMAGMGANSDGHTLEEYVDAIIKMCGDYSIPVLDLFRLSGINTLNITTYTSDGLHPNTAGHARLSKLMANFLKDL